MNLKLDVSYKQIWNISYPLMLGSVALNITNVINTAFLGRISETALGASAIGGVLFFCFVMIAGGLGVGGQILIARKAGEGKKDEIGVLFNHCFYLLSGISVLFFLVLVFIIPDLLKILLKSGNVYNAVLDYLSFRNPGIFFSIGLVLFRCFFSGIARTSVIMKGIVVMAILNIVLDYILIFGNFGFPRMEIKGAGLATSISEGVAFLYYLYLILKENEFKLFSFEKVDNKVLKEIFTLSLPMLLQNTISLGAWVTFFIVIEQLGEKQLAISNILRSLYMLLMTPIWGYATATTTMISNLLGQERGKELFVAIKKLVVISLSSSMIMIVGNLFFPEALLSLFTKEVDLIHDAIPSLNIISLSMLLFSIAAIMLCSVSGTGDTKFSLGIEVLTITCYVLYLFYTAIFKKYPASVVWGSEILYWTMLGSLSFWRLWVRKKDFGVLSFKH